MVFKRRDKPPLSPALREALLPRRGWRRGIEYLGHRVRRLPDTPHRIALGFACGVFASFTPFFGLHLVWRVALAWLIARQHDRRADRAARRQPAHAAAHRLGSRMALGRRILGYGVTGRDFERVLDAFVLAASAASGRACLSLFGLGESQWRQLAPFFSDVICPTSSAGCCRGSPPRSPATIWCAPLVAAYQAGAAAARAARRALAQLQPRPTAAADRPISRERPTEACT